jgi:hypothetical protein
MYERLADKLGSQFLELEIPKKQILLGSTKKTPPLTSTKQL